MGPTSGRRRAVAAVTTRSKSLIEDPTRVNDPARISSAFWPRPRLHQNSWRRAGGGWPSSAARQADTQILGLNFSQVPSLELLPTPRTLPGVERISAWSVNRMRRGYDPAARSAAFQVPRFASRPTSSGPNYDEDRADDGNTSDGDHQVGQY